MPSWDESKLLALHQTPRQPYDQGYITTGYVGLDRLQYPDFVLRLLIETAQARELALSYRGFNVAAGAYALADNQWGKMVGYNIKLDDTDAVNIHAEDLAANKAAQVGMRAIATVAVIGPVQTDQVSGRSDLTLHPCGRCRGRLADNPLIAPNDTLFVSATPDFRAVEFASLQGLIARHDKNDRSGITSFTFDQTPKVFEPLDVPPNKPINLLEADAIDTSDWDDGPGAFLLTRAIRRRSVL